MIAFFIEQVEEFATYKKKKKEVRKTRIRACIKCIIYSLLFKKEKIYAANSF